MIKTAQFNFSLSLAQ